MALVLVSVSNFIWLHITYIESLQVADSFQMCSFKLGLTFIHPNLILSLVRTLRRTENVLSIFLLTKLIALDRIHQF